MKNKRPEGKREYDYCLLEMPHELEVTRVMSQNKEDAEREIQHYALMYSQDGPVKIVRRSRKLKPERK